MSTTVYYEPYKLPAGILAFVVHSVFFALLYLGFNWNRPVFLPEIMSVELWTSLPEEVAAPPVHSKVEEIVAPPQEKMAAPDIVMPDKKKAMTKPVEIKPEKIKTAFKPPEVSKSEVVKPKPDTAKPAEQKPDTRIADQQAARISAEQVRQDEQAAANNRLVDENKEKIMAKIRRNIVMPPDVAKDARAEFLVTLLPGGAVLPPKRIKSSGNTAYDIAVERAILKSDPLPLPPDVQLFNRFRELNLVFKPTE